jgi:hypothetical protein
VNERMAGIVLGVSALVGSALVAPQHAPQFRGPMVRPYGWHHHHRLHRWGPGMAGWEHPGAFDPALRASREARERGLQPPPAPLAQPGTPDTVAPVAPPGPPAPPDQPASPGS